MIERLTGANHKELGFHTYIGAKNPYSVALTLGELLLDNTNPKYRPREILNDVFDRLAAYEDSGLSPEEVQKMARAKVEGRLVVLPCKVGTRVWVIGQDCDLCHDMYTEEPCLFGDCEYRKVIESVFLPGMTDEFGKTVFLTREEAEKALQEGLEWNKRG